MKKLTLEQTLVKLEALEIRLEDVENKLRMIKHVIELNAPQQKENVRSISNKEDAE